MQTPGAEWSDKAIAYLGTFGSGIKGFIVLAMVLLTIAVVKCLPSMWKDWLDYKKSKNELGPKVKDLDLKILAKVEKLQKQGDLRIVVEPRADQKAKKEIRQ